MSRILNQPALAVGGIGGSGTRAIAATLQALGCDIGFDLNDALDDLTFTSLFKDDSLWPLEQVTPTLTARLEAFIRARQKMDPAERTAVAEVFRQQLPMPDESRPWQQPQVLAERLWAVTTAKPTAQKLLVWKEPNTHIALPALLNAMPKLRFIQVVRHGLDMAWSSNQNQLRLWGSPMLGRPIDPHSAQDSFDYWCACHQRLLRLQQRWPDRISWLNLEQLAEHNDSGTAVFAASLEGNDLGIATPGIEQAIADCIRPPTGQGRFREHPALVVTDDQRQLLAHFGYTAE